VIGTEGTFTSGRYARASDAFIFESLRRCSARSLRPCRPGTPERASHFNAPDSRFGEPKSSPGTPARQSIGTCSRRRDESDARSEGCASVISRTTVSPSRLHVYACRKGERKGDLRYFPCDSFVRLRLYVPLERRRLRETGSSCNPRYGALFEIGPRAIDPALKGRLRNANNVIKRFVKTRAELARVSQAGHARAGLRSSAHGHVESHFHYGSRNRGRIARVIASCPHIVRRYAAITPR